jgi:hypothetical protein
VLTGSIAKARRSSAQEGFRRQPNAANRKSP